MAFQFYEFFAGGGMARQGLGGRWNCLFANDIDPKKAQSYRDNHPDEACFQLADIETLTVDDLPGRAHLAWASFPCQDFSFAGQGNGFKGRRSSTDLTFLRLLDALEDEDRRPPGVPLENVCGAITANRGADFERLVGEAGVAWVQGGRSCRGRQTLRASIAPTASHHWI